jgi:long-chain acyl-CoA synthetase
VIDLPPPRPGDETPLSMFERTVAQLGSGPLVLCFDTPLGADTIDELSHGLAASLQELGIGAGDRVALYLQNDPEYLIACLAIWRLEAIAVACNPMLRRRELASLLSDCRPAALIALDELLPTARGAIEDTGSVRVVVACDPMALRSGQSPAPVPLRSGQSPAPVRSPPEGALDFSELARRPVGPRYQPVAPAPEHTAVLTYTSGTTGPPKGAMNTHGNIAFVSRLYRDWWGLTPDDRVFGISPLFHVTGLTAHIGVTLATAAPLLLMHRFDPAAAARLGERHRASATVAAITAFIALANDETAQACDLSRLRRPYSGGAPIPPAVVDLVQERLGFRIRPVYGLTETTGPCVITPVDRDAPVDPVSGALSAGLAAPLTSARIVGEAGETLASGEVGEVAIRGPQVVPGYWRRPEETAHAIRDGELLTGDVGVIDADGWVYLVDRRKDMIIASGFKVWPREVEDVLYEHPAVREAAVIGVADDYRGETVSGYVSLKAGATATPGELVEHCRERLAAYKRPRVVQILPELPKTPTGKILRRELRER